MRLAMTRQRGRCIAHRSMFLVSAGSQWAAYRLSEGVWVLAFAGKTEDRKQVTLPRQLHQCPQAAQRRAGEGDVAAVASGDVAGYGEAEADALFILVA
jgi:precorrin-3B methylase